MAAKNSASTTAYRAFFHGLGQLQPIAEAGTDGETAPIAAVGPLAHRLIEGTPDQRMIEPSHGAQKV